MKTIYTSERKAWREWLAEHFETESEIWFVFPMKESGDKALSYNDAVEEAFASVGSTAPLSTLIPRTAHSDLHREKREVPIRART